MNALFATNNDYGMTVLRVASGLAMLPFGLMKVGLLQVPNMPGGISTTIDMMGQMGIPAFITVLVMLAETLGALALIAGFCTRFCAASLAVIMLGATWFVFSMGYFSGYVIPVLFCSMYVVLTINGAGAYSVDKVLAAKMN